MKLILLSTVLFFSQQMHALQIQSVTVSAISTNSINVSLNTEAVELYYFNSWQYFISGNSIVVEACFISGFGSTIAYLNNNFQIPLNTLLPATYHLTVKVYYCNSGYYIPRKLQDQVSGTFKSPLREKVVLFKKNSNSDKGQPTFFPNPTSGAIMIYPSVFVTNIFDSTGKEVKKIQSDVTNVSLEELPIGQYFIEYFYLNKRKIKTIIVKR